MKGWGVDIEIEVQIKREIDMHVDVQCMILIYNNRSLTQNIDYCTLMGVTGCACACARVCCIDGPQYCQSVKVYVRLFPSSASPIRHLFALNLFPTNAYCNNLPYNTFSHMRT